MASLNEIKHGAEDVIDEFSDELKDLSYRIHENPEISYKEYEASELLTGELENLGFSVERGVADLETAFRATYSAGEKEPKVCLMVECDALEDLGHAAGHNLSGVSSIGAAIALRKAMEENELDGELVVMGTPAEEMGGAKADMVETGLFNDVDAAMSVQMFDKTVLDPKFIALNGVRFTFHGKPAHAAGAPEVGINALNGVIQTFQNIDSLRQHVREDVRMHGIITDGGAAVNIVPETAQATFFIRAPRLDGLSEVMEKVKNCAKGAALATGTELDIDCFESIEDLTSNPVMVALFDENVSRYTKKMQATTDEPVGSTDVGTVSKVVPTINPMISVTDEMIPLHTKEFEEASASEKGYEAMLVGAKALALTALDLICEEGFLRRVKETFAE